MLKKALSLCSKLFSKEYAEANFVCVDNGFYQVNMTTDNINQLQVAYDAIDHKMLNMPQVGDFFRIRSTERGTYINSDLNPANSRCLLTDKSTGKNEENTIVQLTPEGYLYFPAADVYLSNAWTTSATGTTVTFAENSYYVMGTYSVWNINRFLYANTYNLDRYGISTHIYCEWSLEPSLPYAPQLEPDDKHTVCISCDTKENRYTMTCEEGDYIRAVQVLKNGEIFAVHTNLNATAQEVIVPDTIAGNEVEITVYTDKYKVVKRFWK